MLHTHIITLDEQEYDEYLLQSPHFFLDEAGADVVDYEDMFDYFEAKGHNIDMQEEAIDYQNNGVEVEFL
jgi:hypothetical protein